MKEDLLDKLIEKKEDVKEEYKEDIKEEDFFLEMIDKDNYRYIPKTKEEMVFLSTLYEKDPHIFFRTSEENHYITCAVFDSSEIKLRALRLGVLKYCPFKKLYYKETSSKTIEMFLYCDRNKCMMFDEQSGCLMKNK